MNKKSTRTAYAVAIVAIVVLLGALAMIVGLILVPVVSWLSPKPDKAQVEEAFSCYNKSVTTNIRDSLGK